MINLIAALSTDGAIGKGGAIPWHFAEDFKWFKRCTLGAVAVMGRKTYEGLPRRPLPSRETWVLTRDRAFGARAQGESLPGAPVRAFFSAEDLRAAMRAEKREVWICGGAEIYREFLNDCAALYLTRVPVSVPGADAFFPPFEDAFCAGQTLREGADFSIVKYIKR